jgi:hypothetical protein
VIDKLGQNAEDIDVEPIVFDEHLMTNVTTIECELRHALDNLIDKHEGNPLQLSILPFVVVDGSKIYKSTLVSELNGNYRSFDSRVEYHHCSGYNDFYCQNQFV